MEATIVFPHQLFKSHPAIDVDRPVFLVEHPFFLHDTRYQIRYHKQKVLLHRASMKAYEQGLQKKGYQVEYVALEEIKEDFDLKNFFQRKGLRKIFLVDTVDYDLRRLLKAACKALSIDMEESDSPNFINTKEESEFYFKDKKRMFMADFYKYQRRRLGIMIDESLEPLGGKWSYDTENRKKVPKKELAAIPSIPTPAQNEFVKEAHTYVAEHFSAHPGSAAGFRYPVTHEEAEAWLDTFFEQRFALFGPYEDAIVEDEPFLYHGVLTPMLNIGLLDPMEVVRKALNFHEIRNIPLASLEGFIRQIIGWREFIRYSYERYGVTMRTSNHWNHTRDIPTSFYTADTGITPLDVSIQRTLDFAYCHHIERLMILGGFMFICEFDPKQIYKWFMEMFIDAYDWVMVPNVYAMSQHADGGLITTKPYFSGSNYVRKMSHYKTGEWSDIWDGLYWNFIFKHGERLQKNPRWAMMVRTSQRMAPEKREAHLTHAASFLTKL
ncbi:MAG: cryptochrome/photolyase family protein [Bacteroidota bacterium]